MNIKQRIKQSALRIDMEELRSKGYCRYARAVALERSVEIKLMFNLDTIVIDEYNLKVK